MNNSVHAKASVQLLTLLCNNIVCNTCLCASALICLQFVVHIVGYAACECTLEVMMHVISVLYAFPLFMMMLAFFLQTTQI